MKSINNTQLRRVIAAVMIPLPLCLLILGMASAQEQNTERQAKLKDFPSAVQATAKAESRGAVVRGYSMETDDGQTFYEVSLRVNGRSRDVTIDANGNVVEIEDQVSLASLPPAARSEIVKQAGKGRIILVESITKNKAIVAYEAHIRTDGKISEIKVDPEGKPVAH